MGTMNHRFFWVAALAGLSHVACGRFLGYQDLTFEDAEAGVSEIEPQPILDLVANVDGGAPVDASRSDGDPNVITLSGQVSFVPCSGDFCAGKTIRCAPGSHCTIQCNGPGSCFGTRFEVPDGSLCVRCKETDGGPSCDQTQCSSTTCRLSCSPGQVGCGPSMGTCGSCDRVMC